MLLVLRLCERGAGNNSGHGGNRQGSQHTLPLRELARVCRAVLSRWKPTATNLLLGPWHVRSAPCYCRRRPETKTRLAMADHGDAGIAFLEGGGRMGALMRTHDWSTPITGRIP